MARVARRRADGNGGATAIEDLQHPADVTRLNIPTAEMQSYVAAEEAAPKPMLYPRNPDLDPQLVWRGKDDLDRAPLQVDTVPVYIQEKILPEALIRDLRRVSKGCEAQADLFGGFDRISDPEVKTEFYQHAENWSNRMILGDSLLVMNSLAEKEGLRGQVQMIYLDPPYGIRFSSNWQPSTRTREVKEGKAEGLSREPEQIKAFRDTWKDGIHSYLSYLRDRLVVARELLAESGSIFVQIGDENVHLVRSVMDETFGAENFCALISFKKSSGQTTELLTSTNDFLVWYARDRGRVKFRRAYRAKEIGSDQAVEYEQVIDEAGSRRRLTASELLDPQRIPEGWRLFRTSPLTSQRPPGTFPVEFRGRKYLPTSGFWKTHAQGFERLAKAQRLLTNGSGLTFIRYLDDFGAVLIGNVWEDTKWGFDAREKSYVVQTNVKVLQRCILMSTDPGDLVLDPTCGSGTTAYVVEQWGRRWITIDTSRVALALARTRLMAARHPAYLLRDSAEGAAKEAEITGRPPVEGPFAGDIRQGFVLERVSHVTLKSIANNAEIDIIHEKWQPAIEQALATVNAACGKEWEVPRAPSPAALARDDLSRGAGEVNKFWELKTERQKEIDASIARHAETEFLHDKPYPKRNTVRVTGPFTVESLSPHRVLPAAEDDAALLAAAGDEDVALPERRQLRMKETETDFAQVVLENLKQAGVQNTRKGERLMFLTLKPWAGGGLISAEGEYEEAPSPPSPAAPERGDLSREAGEVKRKRAAIVIGPEYGTVDKQLVLDAAREARDLFDVLVVCGFAFDPHVGEGTMSLGRLTVLKARMNQELHAATVYKAGGGNLFVVFGEPDIVVKREGEVFRVEIKGVDIFDPTTGEVRSSGRVEDDIACWFVDTDYDGDSFFVRHAYFLGGKDPFERLKASLRATIDEDAWATLYRTESREFARPKSGRIAVKVINHYGDEAMKVFAVG